MLQIWNVLKGPCVKSWDLSLVVLEDDRSLERRGLEREKQIKT